MKPHISETALHKSVADFFAVALGGNAVALHVRNERVGVGERIEAARMGLLPGFPDFLVLDCRCAFGIELKPPGWKRVKERTGKYTPHELRQREVHERLGRAGVPVAICESVEEVEATLRRWGVALRGATAPRVARPALADMLDAAG